MTTKVFAQIPNADFENWSFFGWFYNPDGWDTNNNQIQSTFKIFNSEGKIVKKFSLDFIAWNMLQQEFGIFKIDVRSLSKGIYFLQLNDSAITNSKFIKQ